MPAKIRLQRQGKKGRPFYQIVVADGRAPRDGKFIEKLGSYNPLTTPATIELDINKSVEWLKNGALPTDTCRAILSYKGVLYKYHLLRGVQKGALTAEQVEAKFTAWVEDKETKIQSKVNSKIQDSRTEAKNRLEAEAKAKEAKAQTIAAKQAALVVVEAPVVEEAPAVEEVATEETTQTEE